MLCCCHRADKVIRSGVMRSDPGIQRLAQGHRAVAGIKPESFPLAGRTRWHHNVTLKHLRKELTNTSLWYNLTLNHWCSFYMSFVKLFETWHFCESRAVQLEILRETLSWNLTKDVISILLCHMSSVICTKCLFPLLYSKYHKCNNINLQTLQYTGMFSFSFPENI